MAKTDFVVVNIKNSQELVAVGDVIEVQKLEEEVGAKIKFTEVLLTCKDGKTVVGKPNVEKASVEVEVLEQTKGEKVDKRVYKAKARYRRHVGHRQQLTKIKIVDIKF